MDDPMRSLEEESRDAIKDREQERMLDYDDGKDVVVDIDDLIADAMSYLEVAQTNIGWALTAIRSAEELRKK